MIDEQGKKSPIPSLLPETQAIIARLRATKVGETVSWSELETMTQRPQARLYNLVRTALRTLEKESIHFAVQYGEGLERLSPDAVAERVVPARRARIRGAAQSMVRTTRNVNLSECSQSNAATILAGQTIGLVVLAQTTPQGLRLLANAIEKSGTLKPMDPREASIRFLTEAK